MPARKPYGSDADRVLTIYKASAGSGKTYTLTYEYILALLAIKNPETGEYRLNHPRYSRTGEIVNRHRGILAITFTNKATEEMKRRITGRLHDLTHIPAPGEKDADYAKELCAVTGCTRTELAQTAMSALHQLLHDFHNFNVSTIDSFFQRVLRGFARELDRQGDFEIELNERAVMDAAVSNMLDDYNISWKQKDQLGNWLFQYMKDATETGRKANILDRNSSAHKDLVDLISKISSEAFTPYEKRMKEYLSANPSLISEALKTVAERIGCLRKEIADKAADIIARLAEMPDNGGIDSNSLKFLCKFRDGVRAEKKQYMSYAEKGAGFKKNASASPSLRQEASEVMSGCCITVFRIEELQLITKGLNTLAFLSFAWKFLDDVYKDNNIVLLANTNALIHRLIDGSDVPFIYERLGLRLHHFLIDEFQDTSTKQWENLRPLVANSIAGHYDNLIIGDVKQSIYRFRNSEPELLHRRVQEDDFPQYSRLRGGDTTDNTNYRSSVEVVTFNNTLFGRLAAQIGAPGYEHVVQAIPEKNADYHGYVRFFPFHVETKKKSKDDDSEQEPKSEEEEFLEKNPQLPVMVEQIRRQLSQGHYRFKDIAILCSKRKECALVIEYLLKYYPDLRVMTNEALYLTKSPAVKLIISMLRLIANAQSARAVSQRENRDYATLADMRLMVSRFEYYNTDPSLKLSPEEALRRALCGEEDADRAVEEVLGSNPASLQALIDNIISLRMPMRMRENQLPYLMALQDYVTEYSEHGIQTVNAFLHWWDERSYKFSIPLGSDIDAITVMTIHKSKGLEFPCLHIPYASWELASKTYMESDRWIPTPRIDGLNPEIMPPVLLLDTSPFNNCEFSIFYKNICDYRRQGEENTTNLTYVAYTRAASELMVYYDPEKGIGTNLTQCLSMPLTDKERQDGFTVDLARHFNAGTGEFSLGGPTVSPEFQEQLSLTDAQKHEKAERQRQMPAPYRPVYSVHLRDDAKVITSVDSLLDTDISDLPTGTPPPGQEPMQARRGNMLHEILSNTRKFSDLPTAVALVAASSTYDSNEVNEAGEFLESALNLRRDELSRWFRDFDHVLCEQSIFVNESSSMPYSKRPDRIVFYDDGTAEVVDFKFTSEELPEHLAQVREYVVLLNRMGITVRAGWLWYPLLPGSPTVKC